MLEQTDVIKIFNCEVHQLLEVFGRLKYGRVRVPLMFSSNLQSQHRLRPSSLVSFHLSPPANLFNSFCLLLCLMIILLDTRIQPQHSYQQPLLQRLMIRNQDPHQPLSLRTLTEVFI